MHLINLCCLHSTVFQYPELLYGLYHMTRRSFKQRYGLRPFLHCHIRLGQVVATMSLEGKCTSSVLFLGGVVISQIRDFPQIRDMLQ